MKKTIFLFICIILAVSTQAQTPQVMKYQAVARDINGDLLVNQAVSVKISILSGGPMGALQYSEVHDVLTNEFGLINLEVGNAPLVLFGVFEAIPWGADSHFLKVEMDPSGGSSYVLMGTSQLMSVPYSLFSEFTAHPEDDDPDPLNEIQMLSLTGTDLTLSEGGGTVGLPNGLWNPDGNNIFYNIGSVGIGAPPTDPNALLQIATPGSGNFDRLLIESPADDKGFGILFSQPAAQWYLGQNIGNWNDGRFQIAPEGSSHWLTMLPNGNIGLTKAGFTTPFARLQVPQNGDIDDNGTLDVNQSAIYIGLNPNEGIAVDRDQVESIGNRLKINALSEEDVSIANGGGRVGINVEEPIAAFHVRGGKTILFGADTNGKTNFYPDPKMIFYPAKGGAFRVGQLNADGSLIGGTGWNFWDWNKVGWASIAIGNNTRAMGAGSVALGIRGDAANFGSVAIGHLARTKGNSAVAAGYYTRADAFVGCAVGAGNVGGGNANSWIATDPIFEVGNSIDTNNRSNAFTVMKNGRVGINHANPQAMLDIEQPNQGVGNGVLLNLSGYGHWETSVDNAKDYNFFYNNALKAYILDSDGSYISTSDRSLKTNIQAIPPVLNEVMDLRPVTYRFQDAAPETELSYGFVAQEVESVFPDFVVEKDGIKALKYSNFAVIAIQAIQEQQTLIQNQQEIIKSLEKRIQKLEANMN